jgi:hypothetical protein
VLGARDMPRPPCNAALIMMGLAPGEPDRQLDAGAGEEDVGIIHSGPMLPALPDPTWCAEAAATPAARAAV